MIRIALDGLGGDFVSKECCSAIEFFLKKTSDVEVFLATEGEAFCELKATLSPEYSSRLQHLPAEGVIAFDETPVAALKQKPKCSVMVAMAAVQQGLCEAVVSFGHTGAAVVAAQWVLGLIPGVERAGLGAIVPHRHGFGLLMDVGANIKCRSEHLFQYGTMADVYCRSALSIAQPRIGLLNVGEEKCKGDERLLAAHGLMEKADYHFVGNVEGNQIFDGSVDAVICNGLEGNMVLKAAESLSKVLFEALRSEVLKDEFDEKFKSHWRLNLERLEFRNNPDSVGASRLLGVSGLVLIGHGNARSEAIVSALESASKELRLGLQPALIGRLAPP
jgi:phosphate acyltransferase